MGTLHRSSVRGRVPAFVAMFVTLALVVAATTAGGAGAQSGGVLGKPNKATLSPVTVGLITESGSEAIGATAKQVEQGAKIAVAYVNDYLGGIAGHKVKLATCGNRGTPAGGQECANEMVDKGVVAVVMPFTGQGPSEVPIITGAGIPYVTTSAASPEEFSSPVFELSGGFPAILASMLKHAADHGAKKLTWIASDVPSVTTGIKALGAIAAKNAGIEQDVLPVANGTPDITPQLQAAVDGGADAIGTIADVTLCTSFLRAYQTLNLDVPKYLIGICNDKSIISSLGDVLKGSISPPTNPGAGGRDAKLYAEMVKKYGPKGLSPDPSKGGAVSGSVTTYLTFRAFLEGLTGDPTPASVLAQMKAAKDVPVFNGLGNTLTCDGTAIPLTSAACTSVTGLGTMDAKGKVKKVEQIDTAPLFK